MKQQKLQNDLSDERLRKDQRHFLEIAYELCPFQQKARTSNLQPLIIRINYL